MGVGDAEVGAHVPMSRGQATETITIGERYGGPPACGNGGYTSGIIAAYVNANPAVARLNAPVPLGRALDIVRQPDGEVEVTNGEHVVARARRRSSRVEVPEASSALGAVRESAL